MISNETREKMINRMIGNKFALGNKMSDETRKKMSLANRGRIPWIRGRKHSKKAKLKMSIAHKGKKFTLEHRENIRHALMGKPLSVNRKKKISETHKKNPFWLGKKHSPKSKLKMSLAQRGDKGSGWRGGVSPLRERIRQSYKYKLWRTSIFQRDDYTCQFCNERGGDIEADHIIPYSKIIEKLKFQFGIENLYENAMDCELLWDISNGRTLCKECHKTTDTYQNKSRLKWYLEPASSKTQPQ